MATSEQSEKPQVSKPVSAAWLDTGSKSMGRVVDSNLSAYTGGFSSEEDSDSEDGAHLNTSRGMTRSLGRAEMSSIMSKRKIASVSQRLAAYEELVSLSRNTAVNQDNQSPRHSAMKLSDGSDASPVQSRIELNPFFQLDKQGKLQPCQSSDQRRGTSPAKLKARPTEFIKSSSASPSHGSTGSPSMGMSVQMRIKVWSEKEKETPARDTILVHRRSLQPATLMAVESKEDSEKMKESSKKAATQSDDEAIMTKSSDSQKYSRPPRDNVYEQIRDDAVRYRVKEASSSSDASPHASPSATRKSKVVKPDEKVGKKSKWRIRSPLPKRKNKIKVSHSTDEVESVTRNSKPKESPKRKSSDSHSRRTVNKGMSKRSDKTSHSLDIPVQQKGSGENSEEDHLEADLFSKHPEGLPSVFDKISQSPLNGGERDSISGKILNIIDTFGTVEYKCPLESCPTINVGSNEYSELDSESDGEDNNKTAISSLDVKRIARKDLKRRASDSYRTQLGTPKNHVKGGTSSFEESSEGVIATALMYADAVWDREALDKDELSFRVGDVIEILDMTDDVWWHGSVGDVAGWFPASFVRLRVGQDSESDDGDAVESEPVAKTVGSETSSGDCLTQDPFQRHSDPTPDPVLPADTADHDQVPATLPRSFPRQQGSTVRRRMTIRRRDSAASLPKKLTPVQVRAKIIEEIINTERDYVKHLEDIIEGFLKRCKEYNKLFDEERIDVIFSNIEQVYALQKDFLRELEARIQLDHMDRSEIGEVFVLNQHEFKVYAQYCNNHPHAVSEMSSLREHEQYSFFFESCRLLRNLQDISLEGFLLTPVQKICKYPLQLSELLKYTGEDHPDHPHVVAAQIAMKEVAMLINEQKRRIENVGKIGCWQRTIENWKGPDILETSTEMIHCGELHKISKGHSQERHFFLFDHQLVYCKKDAIGGKLSYKGRVDLDHCQIADLTDSAVLHGNTAIRNCWRMNNSAKDNKWYVIFAKNPQVKDEWMKAFQRERERVKEDDEKGFHISMKMKRAAVALCASNSVDSRRKGRSVKKHVSLSESIDGSLSVSKKLAVTVSGTASANQQTRKARTARRKQFNSISGTSSSKVIF